MTPFDLPWLEGAILVPLAGAAWVSIADRPAVAHRRAVALAGLVLLISIGEAINYALLDSFAVAGLQGLGSPSFPQARLYVDGLSAPLLPLIALIYGVTFLATPREKTRRFTFAAALVSESVALATLCTRDPVVLALTLSLGVLFPVLELRARNVSLQLYAVHATAFIGLLAAGTILCATAPSEGASEFGLTLLAIACLLRAGVPPFQSWVTELFERGSFGGAILFVAPMMGAYALMRLCVPLAPPWLLSALVIVCASGAFYMAGLALVQNDARRFFATLALSQCAIVLVGLSVGTTVGLAGALSVWVSAALALTGLGLVLRGLEARIGRFSLARFIGLYAQVPTFAGLFLLTGLALVGFPGTIGFVGLELLLEGSAEMHPLSGLLLLVTSALSGMAVLRAYFRTFTGTTRHPMPLLQILPRERVAVLLLSGLVLGGGLFPQPGVSSRYRAAAALREDREDHQASILAGATKLRAQRPASTLDRSGMQAVESFHRGTARKGARAGT